MTRDEIMALTPEQLRIEIAKALGWKSATVPNTNYTLWQSPDGYPKATYPRYTTTISAAFELLECVCYDISKRVDGMHLVSIYPQRLGNYYAAEADTVPMAISRAWMLMHDGV